MLQVEALRDLFDEPDWNEVLRDQKRLLENNRLNTANYYNPALPEFKAAE